MLKTLSTCKNPGWIGNGIFSGTECVRREYARNILNFQTKRGNDPEKRPKTIGLEGGGVF